MGLFSKKNAQPMDERQSYEVKYNSARTNLILVVVFTAINVIMMLSGGDSYFLFSASIPYYLVTLGMVFTGKYDLGFEIVSLADSFLITTVVIASLITLFYLLCFFLSKNKKIGWIIAALVFFGLDTIGMIYLYGLAVDNILDILFHAWVIFSLVQGIIACIKLKKMPEETVEQPEQQTL